MTTIDIESTFSKKNIIKWIKEEFEESKENLSSIIIDMVQKIDTYRNQEYYNSKNKRIEAIKELSSEKIAENIIIVIASMLNTMNTIQAVATKIGYSLKYDNTLDAVKTGAELLAVCKDSGIYKIISANDPVNPEQTTIIQPLIILKEETIQKIHNTMYLPPLLEAPMDWTSNNRGGYLSKENQGSCILGGKENHHSLPQALDALNLLQSIKWCLDETMLQFDEEYKHITEDMDEVERRKVIQHNDRIKQSRKVYELMLENGNEFFFVWKFDKRGRMYSQGYDINLQGSEYKKAMLCFTEAEYITTEPEQ